MNKNRGLHGWETIKRRKAYYLLCASCIFMETKNLNENEHLFVQYIVYNLQQVSTIEVEGYILRRSTISKCRSWRQRVEKKEGKSTLKMVEKEKSKQKSKTFHRRKGE